MPFTHQNGPGNVYLQRPNKTVPAPMLACSITEAAAATGLSRSYLYTEMQAGRLLFIKAGKRRLVTIDALKSYLATLSQPTLKGA